MTKLYSHTRSPILTIKMANMISNNMLPGSGWTQSEADVADKIMDFVEKPLLKEIEALKIQLEAETARKFHFRAIHLHMQALANSRMDEIHKLETKLQNYS